MLYFRITGIENTAKTIDKIGIPNALKETQSSVVRLRQANSLAKAMEINIMTQSRVRLFHPLGDKFKPDDIILFRGLYPIKSVAIKLKPINKLTTVGLILINKKTPTSEPVCKATSLSNINVRTPKKTTAAHPNDAINGIFLSTNHEVLIEIKVAKTKIPVPHKIPKK